MELTNFGIRLFKSRAPLNYNDFTLRHDGPNRVAVTHLDPHYQTVAAIHYGSSVEAARQLKQLLITRRMMGPPDPPTVCRQT